MFCTAKAGSRGGEEPVALLQPSVEERDGAPGPLGLHGDLGGALPGRREVVDGERSEVSIGIGDLGGERLHQHGGDVAAVRAALDPPPGIDPRRVRAVAGRGDGRVAVEAGDACSPALDQ